MMTHSLVLSLIHISEEGYTDAQLRDRYDAVLHLVSAADGAEQFYTCLLYTSRQEHAAGFMLKYFVDGDTYYGNDAQIAQCAV